jgi:membrane associated rhomboid family serine protease
MWASAMETCYRHPKRETGVSCSNCGRPICPDCMTSTPVGMRCPECARQSTKVRTMSSVTTDPILTYVLIGVNVVAWFGSSFGGNVGDRGDLTDAGELGRQTMAAGDYWSLLTSGFLHVNLFHLLSNMLALWILGTMLEPVLGRRRFGLVYFVALFCGSLGVLIYSAEESVGASGAVFGLMGAAVVVARSRGLNLMESGLGLWLGLNLLITFTIPRISIGGHIGGLIGGGLAALVLIELGERRPLPRYASELLCAAIGVAAVGVSIVQYG